MSRIKFCTLLGDIPDKTLFAFDEGGWGVELLKVIFCWKEKKFG